VTPLQLCLLLSTGLFCLGLVAVLVRGNAIMVLLGVELMLNAANINFIAFWRFGAPSNPTDAPILVIFSIAIAAAEAAVGLALVISVYRHQRNTRMEDATRLTG
jgi:NADH-quinone oxidoreductase subunit K